MRRTDQHGMSRTGTYHTWELMMQRCTNPRNRTWFRYGGRGIQVCERWHRFIGFLADMGIRPPGMTLDRIDTNGNYEPGNCRWATQEVQQNNRRDNRYLSIDGVALTIAQWRRRSGLKRRTLRWRLDAGWDARRAVTTPTNTGNQR
jgi:hypothetical protein